MRWRTSAHRARLSLDSYLPAVLLHYLYGATCDVAGTRGTNLVAALLLPPLIASCLRQIRGETDPSPDDRAWTLLEGISIASLPVLYFFTFLYYTDIVSALLVLCSLRLALERYHGPAAFVRRLDVLQQR